MADPSFDSCRFCLSFSYTEATVGIARLFLVDKVAWIWTIKSGETWPFLVTWDEFDSITPEEMDKIRDISSGCSRGDKIIGPMW